MDQSVMSQPSEAMQQCIQDFMDCHRICLQTVAHYLQMAQTSAKIDFVRLLLDSAEIFHLNANLLLRESPLRQYVYAACAAICEQCAQDCERMGDDAQIKACAEVCRRCAETIQRLMEAA